MSHSLFITFMDIITNFLILIYLFMLKNMPIMSTLCLMLRLYHNAKHYANIMYLTLAWITYSASLQTRRISGRRFSPTKIRLRSQARITPISLMELIRTQRRIPTMLKNKKLSYKRERRKHKRAHLCSGNLRFCVVYTRYPMTQPKAQPLYCGFTVVCFCRIQEGIGRFIVKRNDGRRKWTWLCGWRKKGRGKRERLLPFSFPFLGSDKYTLTPTLNTHRYWI